MKFSIIALTLATAASAGTIPRDAATGNLEARAIVPPPSGCDGDEGKTTKFTVCTTQNPECFMPHPLAPFWWYVYPPFSKHAPVLYPFLLFALLLSTNGETALPNALVAAVATASAGSARSALPL